MKDTFSGRCGTKIKSDWWERSHSLYLSPQLACLVQLLRPVWPWNFLQHQGWYFIYVPAETLVRKVDRTQSMITSWIEIPSPTVVYPYLFNLLFCWKSEETYTIFLLCFVVTPISTAVYHCVTMTFAAYAEFQFLPRAWKISTRLVNEAGWKVPITSQGGRAGLASLSHFIFAYFINDENAHLNYEYWHPRISEVKKNYIKPFFMTIFMIICRNWKIDIFVSCLL